MPRTSSTVPTDVELSILRVLWDHGPATVRVIHNTRRAASGRVDIGYSTTLKMIQVMTEKGLLLKDDTCKPQVYRPAQAREKTQLRLVDDLIQRGFAGSAMKLVLRAASAKRISAEELEEVQRLITAAKTKGGPR